jgi:ABC-type amino acid transport system permease subunit
MAPKRGFARFRPSQPAPWTIRAAFWSIVAGCTLTVLTWLHRLLTSDWGAWVRSQVHSFVRNGRRLEVTPEAAIWTAVLSAILVLLVLAFELVLGVGMLRGLRWPRVVFSLLTIWRSVGAVTGDAQKAIDTEGWLPGGLGALVSLACFVCAVLVWLPVSNAFVRRATTERRAYQAGRLRTR